MRPSSEKLRKLFKYDPDTGVLCWRGTSHQAGTRSSGYWRIKIEGQRYYAHRIIWAMMTGAWPAQWLDHRNRIRHDNRWANLRLATPSKNQWNTKLRADNTSGVKNISFHGASKRWRVEMWEAGKRHIQHFKQFEAAIAAAENLPNREQADPTVEADPTV